MAEGELLPPAVVLLREAGRLPLVERGSASTGAPVGGGGAPPPPPPGGGAPPRPARPDPQIPPVPLAERLKRAGKTAASAEARRWTAALGTDDPQGRRGPSKKLAATWRRRRPSAAGHDGRERSQRAGAGRAGEAARRRAGGAAPGRDRDGGLPAPGPAAPRARVGARRDGRRALRPPRVGELRREPARGRAGLAARDAKSGLQQFAVGPTRSSRRARRRPTPAELLPRLRLPQLRRAEGLLAARRRPRAPSAGPRRPELRRRRRTPRRARRTPATTRASTAGRRRGPARRTACRRPRSATSPPRTACATRAERQRAGSSKGSTGQPAGPFALTGAGGARLPSRRERQAKRLPSHHAHAGGIERAGSTGRESG